MVAGSPLDEWRFLIGTSKSSAKDQFGEKGAEAAVYLASSPEVEGKTDRFYKGKTLSDSMRIPTIKLFNNVSGQKALN